MKLTRRQFLGSSLLTGFSVSSAARRAEPTAFRPSVPNVTLFRTPNGGIQPQVAVDHNHVIHLIYFKGNAAAGDVFYVRKRPSESRFSPPLRVNSHPGSAIAIGGVREAQIAVGKDGRPHVAWVGSAKAQPRGPDGAIPMLYTRLSNAGDAFELQRNVMQYATGLDGGGSVAADRAGNVYVVWHANPKGDGEQHRRVYLARSRDNGRSFAREVPCSPSGTGACGCCGLRAFADSSGNLYVLYRTATALIHRDMELLISKDGGQNVTAKRLAKWTIDACPMTTDSISQGGAEVVTAWETAGQVYYDRIDPTTLAVTNPVAPSGNSADRKHPSVASNGHHTLLAWTEATAWAKGGCIAWELFDSAGRPIGGLQRAPDLPVWGLVAAFVQPDGSFTVIY